MSQFKIQNLKFKTQIRWLLRGLILAVVLWLVFILTGQVLCQIAVTQIEELTNTKICTKSVEFSPNGSVFIKELVVAPEQKAEYDDTILRAKTIYARFGIGSLLLLKPRLKKINIRDFVFDAQYNTDIDKWNLASLKIRLAKGRSGKIPHIRLKRGMLRYSKVSDGQTKIIAAMPVDAILEPAEQIQDGYEFHITTAGQTDFDKNILRGLLQPGRVTISGGIASAGIPEFERALTINSLAAELNYDRNKAYSMNLYIRDLLLTHSSSQNTSASSKTSPLQSYKQVNSPKGFLGRYAPQGQLDISLRAVGNLDQLKESKLVGEICLKNFGICYARFPYLIEQLVGRIDFTEKNLLLKNLHGRHGDVDIAINGWFKDFGKKLQSEIRITSDNMILDNDLYKALSKRHKKLWSNFSPSGLVAIDYCRTGQPQTGRKYTLDVNVMDVEAVYKNFPYPLKNLAGNLVFDVNSVKVSNMISRFDGREIIINGEVTDTNIRWPGYDIMIKVNNIPMDLTLENSLSNRQKSLYRKFDISGFCCGNIKVTKQEQTQGRAAYIADLSCKKTTIKTKRLPLVISDITAKALFTPDLINVKSFSGKYGNDLISLTGRIWPGQQDGKVSYNMLLSSEQADLNDDLFAVLPESLRKVVSGLQLQGKIRYHADLNKGTEDDLPDYKINMECLGDSSNFDWFDYPLKDIKGKLTITKNSIKLDNIIAIADDVEIMPNPPTIKINGQMALVDNMLGESDLELVADSIRIKGKSLTTLKANISYDKEQQKWFSRNLIADCYAGRLTGKFELKRPLNTPLEYLLQIGFNDIDLKQFLLDTTENSKLKTENSELSDYTSGKISGSLSINAALDDSYPTIGRCRLKITDMRVGKLSPLAKLLYVLKLTEPKDFAFEQMLIESYIQYNKLFLEKLDLSGQAIAFKGSGWIDLQNQNVDLNLTARGSRLATAEPSILQSLTESLGHGVVRMEVSGNIYDLHVVTKTLPVIRETLGILGSKPESP